MNPSDEVTMPAWRDLERLGPQLVAVSTLIESGTVCRSAAVFSMPVQLPWRLGRCVTVGRAVLCSCTLVMILGTVPGRAQAPSGLTYDIAPQALGEALAAFARQTGLQVVYLAEIDGGQWCKGAPAGLTPSAALKRLLAGTGLQFEFLNDRSIRIFVASERLGPPARAPPQPARGAEGLPSTVEEVLVTANRRQQVASEVPISMSVWTQDAMDVSGVKDLTDLAALAPGMYFSINTLLGQGFQSSLVVRGISDLGPEATTGIYLDDTPVHVRTGLTSSFGDILPVTFDLERVEVLRGPQGTLGGDAALGGAIHFITNKPSLTDWSGLAHSEVATTDRGAMSYEVGGAVGGPIVRDEIGFRISAWSRRDGGYVDRVNPFTGATVEADANYSQAKSLRAALLFAPADSVRISPAFTYQSTYLHDTPVFYTTLSDPNTGVLRNGALPQQPWEDAFYLASVKVSAAFKGADLTAVTAYSRRRGHAVVDFSNTPETYANVVVLDGFMVQRALSQEVRLASSDARARFNWVAGAWFASSLEDGRSTATPVDPRQGIWGTIGSGRTTQIDGFGEVNLRTLNGLTATLGLRVGHAHTAGETASGSATNLPPPSVSSAGETDVMPRFILSRKSDRYGLLYLTIAKGYQLGGVNFPPSPACLTALSPTYGPDTVWNYELGAKERVFEGRLQLEASLFHMDWRNIQQVILPFDCGEGVTNAGSAASNGLDLSVRAAITDRVRLAAALEYADARYTATVQFADGSSVHEGDVVGNLPNVAAPWSGNISVEADVFRTTQLTVSVHAEDTVRSHNTGPFSLNAPSGGGFAGGALKADPATNLVNARIRFLWERYEAAAFVNNVFDSLPALTAIPYFQGSSNSFAVTFRPRTIGLAGSVRF
jgi:iron complex outermembrane recepter protein